MLASSFRLPDYSPPSKDVLSPIPSLSALHPDPSHPAHNALLTKLDLKRDSLRIFSFAQGGIVVCPEEVSNNSRSGEERQESWAKASGYLQLISTQRKLVSQISVKLVAQQTINFPQDQGGFPEIDEVFKKEIVLRDVWLEKGQNTFEFLLTIPHDSPVHEDTLSGTFAVRYSMIGTVVGGNKGLFGVKDLVARETVWIAAAPALTPDSDHFRLNVHIQGLTEDLGPCSLDVSSSRFVVAGPMFISLTLHSPPLNLKVWAIKAYIDQKVHLTSFRNPLKTATVPMKGFILEEGWEGPYGSKSLSKLLEEREGQKWVLLDASHLASGAGDGSWRFEKAARIPIDRVLGASTHSNTRSSIRTSSELVVDLYYTRLESSVTTSRVLIATIVRKPVFLEGRVRCGCLSDRLSLPDYSQHSNMFIPIEVPVPCSCDDSTDELLAAELEFVRESRARGVVTGTDDLGPESSVLLRRKVGEAY